MSTEIATAEELLITLNLFLWGETNQPIAQIERYEWTLCIYWFLPHRLSFKQARCTFNTTFIHFRRSDWNTRDEKTLMWLQTSSAICRSSVAFTISTSHSVEQQNTNKSTQIKDYSLWSERSFDHRPAVCNRKQVLFLLDCDVIKYLQIPEICTAEAKR